MCVLFMCILYDSLLRHSETSILNKKKRIPNNRGNFKVLQKSKGTYCMLSLFHGTRQPENGSSRSMKGLRSFLNILLVGMH